MGGKATYKKKFDRTYYYYGCNECKNNIKEDYIEESILELLGDIFEYDSVVNEFFLPMIKSKLTNPKEEIEKEIKNQQAKRERIKKAYINGSFTLEEHDKEVKYVDDTIAELERQILEQEQLKDKNNKIKTLTENNEALNLRVNTLNDTIKEKDNEISFLKSKIKDIQNILEYWKDKLEKLISFLHSKLHSWYDKDDKYIDVVNDMYEDNVLDDDDIEELDLGKDKDDYER